MQSLTDILPWAMALVVLGSAACGFVYRMLPGLLMRRARDALRSEIRVETAEALDKQFAIWLAPALRLMIVGALIAGAGSAIVAVVLILRFV